MYMYTYKQNGTTISMGLSQISSNIFQLQEESRQNGIKYYGG